MKIDHIALFCRDLEAMRQFFLDYFEAVSNEQYHNPRTGLRTYILRFPDGGARLELMQRPDTINADPSKPNIGYIHVSFAVGIKEAVDAKDKGTTEGWLSSHQWAAHHWRRVLRELRAWARRNTD